MKPARSIDRATDILLEFIEHPTMNATDLHQNLRIPKPTLYRMLSGLEEKGLIHSFGDPRQYRLGPQILKLSEAWSNSIDLGVVSEPILASLNARTNETIVLFVPYGMNQRIAARQFRSSQALSYHLPPGDISPFTIGAAGKVMLAFFPEKKGARIWTQVKSEAARAALLSTLKQIRKNGYCVTNGDRAAGGCSVSAPILSQDGIALGSIALLMPESRLDLKTKALYVKLIVGAGREISRLAGRSH